MHPRKGVKSPSTNPAMLLGALAVAAKHSGLAATSNIMRNQPTLQRRDLAKLEWAPGALHEKIFGRDHLPDEHSGASYRGIFALGGKLAQQVEAFAVG